MLFPADVLREDTIGIVRVQCPASFNSLLPNTSSCHSRVYLRTHLVRLNWGPEGNCLLISI